MEPSTNNWKVGEIASFPWISTIFKKRGTTIYKHVYSSRFICIRECDETHSGILLKVLGKTSPKDIMIVGGEPFCKDERDDLLIGKAYSSFRFPTLNEVTEALEVIRENPSLMSVFKEASMSFDPNSAFWVREASRTLLLQKKLKFYNATTGTLCTATDDTSRCRLAILHFSKEQVLF